MAITVKCIAGHTLHVKDEYAGKKVQCPQCQDVVRVPAAGRASARSVTPPPSPWSELLDETEDDPQTLPRTRTPRLERASREPQSGGNAWKLPVSIGAGGLVVAAVVILFVLLSSQPAPETVAVADQAAQTAVRPVSRPTTTTPAGAARHPDAPPAANQVASAKGAAKRRDRSNKKERKRRSAERARQNAGAKEKAVAAAGDVAAEAAVASEATGPLAIWDTVRPYKGGNPALATVEDPSQWRRVSAASGDYEFQGDCVVENQRVRLHLPAADGAPAMLWGKIGSDEPHGVPIFPLDQEGQTAKGKKTFRISHLSGDEARVELASQAAEGSEVQIAFHLKSGKQWIEAAPLSAAGGLAMGVESQYVVVPTEFGEDVIFDSTQYERGVRGPLAKENLVVALNCDGNFISVLTFPSGEQAGELVTGSGGGVRNHGKPLETYAETISATFDGGNSVFVGLVPQEDTWYSEPIRTAYSASGHYVSDWDEPYPGNWRLVGRVAKRYRTNDVNDGYFVYGCSWGGTFDCFFTYLYARTKDTPEHVVTPMDIYREALGGAGDYAYLLETEGLDSAGTRPPMRRTKYRDVCNTVDDMKNSWKGNARLLKKQPDYIPRLLADARAIIGRMEARLSEYDQFAAAVGATLEQVSKQEGDAVHERFVRGLRKTRARLRSMEDTRADDAYETAGQIRDVVTGEKAEQLTKYVKRLDSMAEAVRDVANEQETRLKKCREVVKELSELCEQMRQTEQRELEQSVTKVGRLCRSILRNRDIEE